MLTVKNIVLFQNYLPHCKFVPLESTTVCFISLN